MPGRREDGTGSGQVWRELPNSPSNTATVSCSSSLPMVIDVCVSVECRELSETRKDGDKSVQSLSSAKMALQGLVTKTKVPFSLFLSVSLLFSLFSLSLLIQVTCLLNLQAFGVVITEEQEQLIAELEDEQSSLQHSLASLQTN